MGEKTRNEYLNEDLKQQAVNKSKLNDRVIFRCGWCGTPTNENGYVVPGLNNAEDFDKYLEINKGAKEKFVNGMCCPNRGGR